MMPCPKCGDRTAVVDSRLVGTNARRRRLCGCGHAFSTIEQPIEIKPGHWIRRITMKEIQQARDCADRLREITESLEKVAETADA